jgi:hypothetical protein
MNFFLFMRSLYIVLAGCLIGMAGCKNASSGTKSTSKDSTSVQTTVTKAPVQSKLNAEGTQLLMTVVSKYYGLKNAFVATKAAKVDSAAQELSTAADALQTFIKSDSANATALKPYMDTVTLQVKIIMNIKDETCERQRLAFGTLSGAVYGMLKNVDIKNAGIYHEYCPMAFNEKGAYWLSDESEIKNPYFGKKMLECGEVTDSLK